MTNDDYELPKLPPLEEVLRQAKGNQNRQMAKRVEQNQIQIIEIICPILERYLDENPERGKTARVHILGDKVVCEKYMVNEVVSDGTRHSGCHLKWYYEDSKVVYYDCPYKHSSGNGVRNN